MGYPLTRNSGKRRDKMKKLLAVLVLASPLLAQAPVTETLGMGTASTVCGSPDWPCMAPVFAADGGMDGSIAIYNGTKRLLRYNNDGGLVWVSGDYDGLNFTHDSIPGTLAYTIDSKTSCHGGSGRGGGYKVCSVHKWVSGGTLTE
jgi:hypothetical protein